MTIASDFHIMARPLRLCIEALASVPLKMVHGKVNSMTKQNPLMILSSGKALWDSWRREYADVQASEPDLHKANLHGAYLQKADLHRSDLTEADLGEADLREANLGAADLRNADLHDADLSDANLFQARLNWADLRGANFSRANLTEADLRGADLRGANLETAILRKARFDEAYPLHSDRSESGIDEVHSHTVVYPPDSRI